MAFFGKTIDEISGGLNQPSKKKVEATVFRHEFGHNLGLVNNGVPPQNESHHGRRTRSTLHERPVRDVMYYAIETTDFFSNVFDGTIPTFEQFCTEDMAAQDG